MHACTDVCKQVRVGRYACVYTCMYVYIYLNTHTYFDFEVAARVVKLSEATETDA